MPTRPNKHFEKWRSYFSNLPHAPHLTQSQCRSLKKLLSECPDRVKIEQWEELFGAVNAAAERFFITIDPEHEEKGRVWIKTQARKIYKSLELNVEKELFEGCNVGGIKHFYFGGFMDATSHLGKRFRPNHRVVVPVWRVERNDGKIFSYAYGAWQGFDKVIVDPPDYFEYGD